MATDLDTASRLAAARTAGDPDDLAQALMSHANTLVSRGRVGEARVLLDEAAAIHHQRGRAYDEARCLQLAATLCRLEGKLDEADRRAREAITLAGPNTHIAVSAETELGEIALARRDGVAAAQHFGQALEAGTALGLVGSARAALLRKHASALAMTGKGREAAADLGEAHDLFKQAGDAQTATRALVEQATALHGSGDEAASLRATDEAMQEAVIVGDHAAQSDLFLLEAAQRLQRNDAVSALSALRSARQQALEATAPTQYIAAAIAISELSEATGDRVDSYEALATGWATLSDLLGKEVARASFEPKLVAMRQRWGVAAFEDVKSAYESRRRAAQSPKLGRVH